MSRAPGWLLLLAGMLAACPALSAEPAHDPSQASGNEHADHASHAAAAGQLPRTPIPAITDADRAAALPPEGGEPAHDNGIHAFMLADRVEAWNSDTGSGFAWQGEGWIGTDLHRAWVRSSGEYHDRLEAAEVEVLYGRGIAAWWDLLVGLRHEFRPADARSFLALGIQGLAPQNFGIEATAYLRDGQVAARFETSYQLLFTNRLILQPHLELDWFGEDEPQRGIGSGLATLEAGLRLRYEIQRRFAPYAGIAWQRALGETGELRRGAGDDVDDLRLVAGIRMWF